MKLIHDMKTHENFAGIVENVESRLSYYSEYFDPKVDEFFIELMKSNVSDKVKKFFMDGSNKSKDKWGKIYYNSIVSHVCDYSIFGNDAMRYLENSKLESKPKAIKYLMSQEKGNKDIPEELFIWFGALIYDSTYNSIINNRVEFFKYLTNYDEEVFKKLLQRVLKFNYKKDSYNRIPLSTFLTDKKYNESTVKNEIEYARQLKKYLKFDNDIELKNIDEKLDPSFDFLVELRSFYLLYSYIDKALNGLSWNNWKFDQFKQILIKKFGNDAQRYIDLMALPNIFWRQGIARQFSKTKYAKLSKLLKFDKKLVLEAVHDAYFKDWN